MIPGAYLPPDFRPFPNRAPPSPSLNEGNVATFDRDTSTRTQLAITEVWNQDSYVPGRQRLSSEGTENSSVEAIVNAPVHRRRHKKQKDGFACDIDDCSKKFDTACRLK